MKDARKLGWGNRLRTDEGCGSNLDLQNGNVDTLVQVEMGFRSEETSNKVLVLGTVLTDEGTSNTVLLWAPVLNEKTITFTFYRLIPSRGINFWCCGHLL